MTAGDGVEPPIESAVIERAHDVAAVSHLIPPGEWTPQLVALVQALHDLRAASDG